MPTVTLDAGTIHYENTGPVDGRPVVFVHGYMAAGNLWQPLSERLSAIGLRCVAPTWPLGSQPEAMRQDAALTLEGIAEMVIELTERLDLHDVVLVGNDTGGAIAQIVAGRRPERLGALVLTNCDAFEHFPPPILKPFIRAARGGPLRFQVATQTMRLGPARQRAFGDLAHTDIKKLVAGWVTPTLKDPAVRENLRVFTASLTAQSTLDAAKALTEFNRPTLIAWSTDDVFFYVEDAERLAATIPDARLETIANARTLSMIDQPDQLAELIARFVAASGHRTERRVPAQP